MMKKSSRTLVAAITMACLGIPEWAGAYTTEYVYHSGQKFAELYVMNKGESFLKEVDGDNADTSAEYTLSAKLINATKSSTAYWAGILNSRVEINQPWQVAITTKANFQNANAGTASYSLQNKKVKEIEENYLAENLQGKRKLEDIRNLNDYFTAAPGGDYAVSGICIGQHMGANRDGAVDGWWVDTDTVLPTNEQAVDFVGTFRHELGHALGISGNYYKINTATGKWENGDVKKPLRLSNREAISKFTPYISSRNSWNMHLVDQNGKPARPGMVISSTDGIKETLAHNPGLTEDDLFIVDNGLRDKNLSGSKGYAYFVGKNVTEVLDGATFNGVVGLPINAWEDSSEDENKAEYFFEGSHLQTTGMMSHRPYSNYTSFMEAELAVMQDLGYDIDRKAYFGYSVYGNGKVIQNTHGYSARNAAGTGYIHAYSDIPLGIGLHIYGSQNKVTQSANILTHGTGATGIRVDGIENTLIIPKSTEIHADGQRGNGILIAYGRGHKIQQQGTVTAKGKAGTGIRFDFGSSSNGALDEYRGSYIRYKRVVNGSDGKIIRAENKSLTDMDKFTYNSAADELNGAMVDSYDLYGTLQGGENAIYISKNAWVKNINVQNGAQIIGNITSDWMHFKTDGSYDDQGTGISGLALQYQGKEYAYDWYLPELVTNLNFSGDHVYSGKINGYDNMKMNVKSGTLAFDGTADVLNVQVDKGAALFGGTYTVKKMSAADIAPGFSDDTTGQVINHGTLGASSAGKNVQIYGDLTSDGVLVGQAAGSEGAIVVSQNADIDGSTVLANHILPDESFATLTAGSITGQAANDADHPYKGYGLMNVTAKKDSGNTLVKVEATAANNMGTLESRTQETYEAVENMRKNMQVSGDRRLQELRPLYSLSVGKAQSTLQEIRNSSAPQLLSLAQQSTVSSQVIADRLSTAFSMQPVILNVPASNLVDGDQENDHLQLTTNLPLAQDNNAWVKFTKNWGDLRGGANYHGSAISGGYDKAFGKNYRAGLFVSYNATSLGAESSRGNTYDTRVGLYGGYHKDARDAYVYLDYGIARNKLHRGITALGLTADADYSSHILEIGGEYKYDLQSKSGKIWHVSPYVGFQLSHMRQGAYQEKGAGIFNQQVDAHDNTYFAGTCGLEFKRYLGKGNYGMRLGVRHAFAGANPELSFRYEGYDGRSYSLSNSQDKTHFQLALSGEAEFAPGWILAGDAGFLRGRHDKDVSCALTLRKVW